MRKDISDYLAAALHNKTLDVHFQPQFCKSASGKSFSIVGAEALVRPSQTVCNAEYLIKVATKGGLITDLGMYVIRKAMRQLNFWRARGLVNDTFNMSVNVTKACLESPTFYKSVLEAIEVNQVDPYQVTLEISEAAAIDDMNIAKIYQLSKEGINISLDDFGKGYSSLARLKLLPISEIKIDRQFVVDITKTDQDVAIITAMYQLTQALSKFCVVEGVETQEQFRILDDIGFECYQGYHFSEDLTAKDFSELLKLTNSLHLR